MTVPKLAPPLSPEKLQVPTREKIARWVHDHPTMTKMLEISGVVFGAGVIAWLPFVAPALGTLSVTLIGIGGGLLALASLVAFFALDIFMAPGHDVKNHVFQPGECEGGKLYYEGDVPILSLDYSNPFKAGKAHGYLCGDAINRLAKRFHFMLHTVAGHPRAHQIPKTLGELRKHIPQEYLREIEGMTEGYNQWVKEQYFWKFPKKLTVDEFLLLQLIPDSVHFQTREIEQKTTRHFMDDQVTVACTSIIEKNAKGVKFARNMDWPSFGITGTNSLLFHRKHPGKHDIIEVGIPTLIGTLTGMNDKGLSLATNVCRGKTEKVNGMPAILFNRYCLENHETVEDVQQFVRGKAPLGPYHMVIADENEGRAIHFYQTKEEGRVGHLHRFLKRPGILTALNYRYAHDPKNKNRVICSQPMNRSRERQIKGQEFFEHRENRSLEKMLSGFPFNHPGTLHTIVMNPSKRKFKVAFDNGFSADRPLHSVDTQKLGFKVS